MGSEHPILGRTLAGRFRVTGFIGEGAMASVYRAVQDGEPRDVALKIMHPHLVSDATFVGRFRREAKAAARIIHPNTVRILDTGVDGKLLYIAMELLAGRDLFELLVLERRLSPAHAARVMIEIADALIAAHASGVVHRDLKPENIMLIEDPGEPGVEHVKVLDFGIAKLVEREAPSSDAAPSSSFALTNAGVAVGTPAYMSPEQCRGEAVDARSDVYSAGILLYQLVSGRLPFASAKAVDLAVAHVRDPPPPIGEIVPEVDPRLAAIIHKALGKWPAQRHQTAAELRDELSAILPELSTEPLIPIVVRVLEPMPPPPLLEEPTPPRTSAPSASSFDGEVTLPADAGHVLPPEVLAEVPENLRPPPKPVPSTPPAPIRRREPAAPSTRGGGRSRLGLLVVFALVIGLALTAAAVVMTRG